MKRFTALMFLMAALMFTSTAKADYTINRFPVYEGPGEQIHPDIDGQTVSWESSDTDIYWTQIGNPEPNVLTAAGTQTDPKVSGGVMVWYDNHTYNGTQKDIYGYNLQDESDLFITFNDNIKQWYPDISGDTIVYEHLGSVYNVYVYDISSGSSEAIELSSTHQLRPAVDGNLVVWGDVRENGHAGYDIYLCDLSVTPFVTSAVSANDSDQWDPAISGRIVVWAADPGDGSGRNIYGYNLDDPATGMFVICDDAGNQNYPAISGNIVAWQDEYDGTGSYDIWGIDLADMGAGYFEVSEGTKDNRYPAVSGNTIVWQRYDQNWDIYGAKLLVPSTVTVTDPNGGESYLAASSMTITWTDTGPVDDVLIEFSSNGGTSWTDVNTVENIGSYLWNPIADLDSANCLIRVSNTNDDTAIDQSDAPFEIYQIPDSITITDPNGGEQFLAGSEMDIRWTSVGEINDVKIEFSSNNRIDWESVISSTPNDGEFTWASVSPDANSLQCSIRISDVVDASTKDVSDEVFIVFQCDSGLTADLTGDCFVDIADLAELALQWLLCGNPYDETWCLQ